MGRLRGFAWAAVVLAAIGTPVAVAPTAGAEGCPVGQHEDTATPGFQCVPGWCPTGTLLDAVTGSCVTAPGVPPPPLR